MSTESYGIPIILVVDDERECLKARAVYFEQGGLRTRTATNFDTAIDILKTCDGIDLVITDIHLSSAHADKSGIALARWIKDTKPAIPVVGYSAYFESDELASDDLSAFDVIYYKGNLGLDDLQQVLEQCHNLAMRSYRRRVETKRLQQNLSKLTHEQQRPLDELKRKPTAPAFTRQVDQFSHLASNYSWIVSIGFIIGTLACAIILALVMFQPNPTIPQFIIFRIVLSLGGAAYSMALTGFITIRLDIPGKGFIVAGGTLAVFLVLFFFSPNIGILPVPP